MGGGRAPARQGAPTAAVAATTIGNDHHRYLQHIAISGTHAGGHAQACVSGYGNAAVGGGQAGHAQGIAGMRAKAHVRSCIIWLPVRLRRR